MLTQSQQNYLICLRANFPEIYNQYASPAMQLQLGDDTSGDDQSTFASIIDSITSAIPSLAQAYTATQASQLAQQTALAKATVKPATTFGMSTTTLAIAGAVLVGGILLLRRK